MNQEDRLLLEKLNAVIANNPRLLSYRLSLRSHQKHKQALLKMWLVGFLFGMMTAAGAIAIGHRSVVKDAARVTPATPENISQPDVSN